MPNLSTTSAGAVSSKNVDRDDLPSLPVAKEGWLSRVYKEGWVTSVQADGTKLLVQPAAPPPSKPELSASERKARSSCVSIATMLQSDGLQWHFHDERIGEVGFVFTSTSTLI